MRSIYSACEPRSEVLSGELREEIFAARLRDVMEGSADAVYGDAELFFENTYPTEGLKLLLSEALGRLSGSNPANNAIIRLETAFGGGKTHNLIALYHAASGYCPSEAFAEADIVPVPGTVDIAGVVGSDLEPTIGLDHGDVTTFTLWGEIAYQLGGYKAFQVIEQSEQTRTAPGTGLLERLIGNRPTLIMLDEVARYLRSAKTIPTAGGRSDLAEQTIAFLMSLFEFAASKQHVVVVLTLADTSDAFGNETQELRDQIALDLAEAKRLSARQERVITPTSETELAAIVTHRLFRHIDSDTAYAVAQHYLDCFRQSVDAGADLPQRALRAEYQQEIIADYPFHPELLTTLNRKVSTIPNFQRTRGALRLLAMVVRDLWSNPRDDVYLIHPHHVNLAVEGIANDLTSRLERPRFGQVISADIKSSLEGSKAHAQALDEALGGAPLTECVATTAYLHSLTQGVASGVDPADLTLAVLYLPEAYAELGWPIAGVTEPPPRPGPNTVDTCPICGNPIDQCTCGTTPPRREALTGKGVPAQAFQRLYDLCQDQNVGRLRQITVSIEGEGKQGATEVRALGLAIPQLGKADFWIEQHLSAEFATGGLQSRHALRAARGAARRRQLRARDLPVAGEG